VRLGLEYWALGAGFAVAVALRGTGGSFLLAAMALAALFVLAERLHLRRATGDRAALALVGGATAVVLLAESAQHGVRDGAGLVLCVMLLAALAGTLLLAADRLSGGASALAPTLGRRSLMLAAGLGLPVSVLLFSASPASAGVVAGMTWLLACGCVVLLGDDEPAPKVPAFSFAPIGAALGVVGLIAVGFAAWRAEGGYLEGETAYAVVVALAGIAAAQTTGVPLLRSLLFAGAAVAAWTMV
jgi:hypothetical protein